MRIKTLMGTIINVDRIKRSITVEGIELGSDCRALVSKHKRWYRYNNTSF